MEPKSMTFSAGAAFLLLYYLAPDAAEQLGATTTLEEVTLAGLAWAALTAVIQPIAMLGKAILARLTAKVEGSPE